MEVKARGLQRVRQQRLNTYTGLAGTSPAPSSISVSPSPDPFPRLPPSPLPPLPPLPIPRSATYHRVPIHPIGPMLQDELAPNSGYLSDGPIFPSPHTHLPQPPQPLFPHHHPPPPPPPPPPHHPAFNRPHSALGFMHPSVSFPLPPPSCVCESWRAPVRARERERERELLASLMRSRGRRRSGSVGACRE